MLRDHRALLGVVEVLLVAGPVVGLVAAARLPGRVARRPLLLIAAGAPRDGLTYQALRTLADLDPAVAEVTGWTRYRIEGTVEKVAVNAVMALAKGMDKPTAKAT